MTDILFGIIISVLFMVYIALLVAFTFYVQETNKEKAKLINALIAKTPEQARDLNLSDKVQPIHLPKVVPSDLIPMEQLSDDDFDKHIQSELQSEEG